jgi:hypothetical protein
MINKRIWLSVIQFVVVIVAVGWLVSIAAEQQQLHTHNLNWAYLAGALAVNTAALTAMGIRLRTVASAGRLHTTAANFVALNFRSIFYLFVLPLGIGMESARYVGFRHLFSDATRTDLVRVIFTDRGLGLLTSLAFAAIAWLVHGSTGIALGVTAAIAIMTGASIIVASIASLDRIKVLAASAISFAIHALTCASVWLLCTAFGIEIELWLVVFAISAGVFGAIIPLALAGVQAGDFVAAGVLGAFDIDTVTALGVATLYYLTRLEGAGIGALLELRRSSTSLIAELGKPAP